MGKYTNVKKECISLLPLRSPLYTFLNPDVHRAVSNKSKQNKPLSEYAVTNIFLESSAIQAFDNNKPLGFLKCDDH